METGNSKDVENWQDWPEILQNRKWGVVELDEGGAKELNVA